MIDIAIRLMIDPSRSAKQSVRIAMNTRRVRTDGTQQRPVLDFGKFVACIGVMIFAGCSEQTLSRVPVSGHVTIDGRPLSSGSIRFVPEHGRPASSGIDKAGRFRLASQAIGEQSREGLEPGLYRVAVTSNQFVGDETAVWLTPPKYADFRTSGLEVVIDQPLDELKIELSWDGEHPDDDTDAAAAADSAQRESVASANASAADATKDTGGEDEVIIRRNRKEK